MPQSRGSLTLPSSLPLYQFCFTLQRFYFLVGSPPVVSLVALSSHPHRPSVTKTALLPFPSMQAPEWPDQNEMPLLWATQGFDGPDLGLVLASSVRAGVRSTEAQKLRVGRKWVPRGESRCCCLKRGYECQTERIPGVHCKASWHPGTSETGQALTGLV